MRECYIRILASYYYQYQYRYRSRERETQGHTQSAGATTRHRTSSKLHYIHRVGAHAPSLPAIVSRVPFAHTLIAAAVAGIMAVRLRRTNKRIDEVAAAAGIEGGNPGSDD